MKDNCNICNSRHFELVKSELRDDKIKFKVFRCLNCEHIQLLPRVTEKEHRAFYNNNLQDRNRGKEIDFEKLRLNNLFDTNRHVKLVTELCGDRHCRILDIGSGYGFFVNEIYNFGYVNVTGIEVSRERRAIAMENGTVKIIDFDLNKPNADIGKFDVITLFHVLEHMADPIAFLKNIRNLLDTNGILICEVPNVKEMLLDICSGYNDFYWITAHLNYFSKKTLLECFKVAGYNNVDVKFEQRYGLMNLSNWLITGEPQIDKPVFEMPEAYKEVELHYREFLEKCGRSDTIIAVTRNNH